ncbi:serine/threonine-protein kinase [Plantactinospora sp. WMMC1484]|uniref:serine/threonine-protein kinase n=1 Tax=Plantactinospora sp. WMMC1484 TaxID=3404122 RepID=UPI003BF52C80
MAALQAGGLLARRYRLIDRIGAGGMSVIWRARDEVLDRVVAVKVLAASLAADAKFREMVREEARAAAQLVHPHVTAVHDYGETLGPDGGITAFVVMELLTGEELKAELTAGPLPWQTAVEICAQVAEALAAAHRLGIVHRDITPANIMMTATGAKVLDFGIATQVGAPDEDEDGETFGTPAYVAPERLDGLPAQPATDTYSLGVLLYETLTGRVPFPADTWEELTRAMQVGTEPTLEGVPDLPPAVADICLRCLARDPVERPTAAQVGELLRHQLLAADPRRAVLSHTRPGAVSAVTAALPSPAAPALAAATIVSTPQPPTPHVATPAQLPTSQTPTPHVPTPQAPDGHAVAAAVAATSGNAPTGGDATGRTPPGGTGRAAEDQRPAVPGPTAPAPPVPAGPATVPPRPGRVLLVATAALVVLTVTVVLVSVLGPESGSGPTGANTAGPDAVATPTSPGTPGPGAAGPAATPGTAGPVDVVDNPNIPPQPLSEVMAQLYQIVDDGVTANAIEDHAGVDLRNHLRNLRADSAGPTPDLAGQVTLLRDKVTVRRDEGSISPEYAELLDAALVRLASAV